MSSTTRSGSARRIPEIRFFILDRMEFASLLEKNVYPTSPINIWEGKRMVHKRHAIESGLESALYYEVVQTGDPSYAYLNDTNNAVTQASVMAHVVGHCEFSERNVLRDSSRDRTEYVMYLVRKVDQARQQMGARDYLEYWNAVESARRSSRPTPSTTSTTRPIPKVRTTRPAEPSRPEAFGVPSPRSITPVFDTLTQLLAGASDAGSFEAEQKRKRRDETISRKGYVLKAPCQDVFGFLWRYAPASRAERILLEYKYVTKAPQDFVMRTQIMNEGWAMYWERKIMHELFAERAVDGIIDYSRVFANVCMPRPYFQRNPYHLGYHLWRHIEQLYREGKVSLEYREEVDRERKDQWAGEGVDDPVEAMGHLVDTITDYELLRRFLTPALIHELHLNRIDARHGRADGAVGRRHHRARPALRLDRPRADQGGDARVLHALLPAAHLRRRHGLRRRRPAPLSPRRRQPLRKDWIRPTLRNVHRIWKAPVAILSGDQLFAVTGNQYKSEEVRPSSSTTWWSGMRKGEPPFRGD